MIFLFLAVFSSSLMALMLKFTETGNFNRYAITSANYVSAFSLSLMLSCRETPPREDISAALFSFMEEFFSVVVSGIASFSHSASLIWAVIVGMIGGVFYCFGFIYIQKSTRENGAGMTGAVGKLGIFIPMVLSLILWKEIPGPIQVAGIIMCVISVAYISIPFDNSRTLKKFNATLLLLFLVSGCADFTGKVFEKYAMAEYKTIFLFSVFFVAFWLSLFFTLADVKKGKPVKMRDLGMGVLVGIPNLFTSYFLISSFKYYPASVAFPIFCSGSIVLITVGGYFVFRERLSRGELGAVSMIIASIVLMNMG